MKSIRTFCRAAYKARYSFDMVLIERSGAFVGYWRNKSLPGVVLGHIDDCRTQQTATGVRFYNRDFLVHTFGPKGEGA